MIKLSTYDSVMLLAASSLMRENWERVLVKAPEDLQRERLHDVNWIKAHLNWIRSRAEPLFMPGEHTYSLEDMLEIFALVEGACHVIRRDLPRTNKLLAWIHTKQFKSFLKKIDREIDQMEITP